VPWAAQRPCAVVGCSGLTRRGEARCPEHAHLAPKKKPRPAEYHTALWRRVSQAHRARHPVCEFCGVAPAEEVDHILSTSKGGAMFDEANLRSLCKRCHARKTNAEDGAGWRND